MALQLCGFGNVLKKCIVNDISIITYTVCESPRLAVVNGICQMIDGVYYRAVKIMAKNFEMYSLLDFYGCLLTEKQLNIMNMYYNDDLSLGEVAQQCGISRQGVHDAVKHCEKALAEYEEKLGLLKAQSDHVEQLKEFKAQAMDIFNECKRISLSRPIAEKTIVLLENLDSKLAEFENDSLIAELESSGGISGDIPVK